MQPQPNMNPQQLSDDLRAASLAEFGDTGAEMFPAKYFNPNVRSIDPAEGRTPRMPKYCATNFGAICLKLIFSEGNPDNGGFICTGLGFGNAMLFTGLLGSYTDTEPVPYLAFGPDITAPFVNAGTLLDYLNHGYGISKSFEDVLNEIRKAT